MSIRMYGGGIRIGGVMVPMIDEDVRRLVDECHIRATGNPRGDEFRVMSLAMLQRVVGLWSKQTFPEQTDERILKHLRTEVNELDAAIADQDVDRIADDVADVILLLMSLAERKQIDIFANVVAKHKINTRREFAFDPDAGFDRHVEPDGEKADGAGQVKRPGDDDARWVEFRCRVAEVNAIGREQFGVDVLMVQSKDAPDVVDFIIGLGEKKTEGAAAQEPPLHLSDPSYRSWLARVGDSNRIGMDKYGEGVVLVPNRHRDAVINFIQRQDTKQA